MKKLTAVLCTAAMVLGLSSSVFAAGSIPGLKPQEVVVSQETIAQIQAVVPGAEKIVVREPLKEQIAEFANNESAKEALEYILDMVNFENTEEIPAEQFMEKMVEKLDIKPDPEDPDGVIRTTAGNPIEPLDYEPVSKFSELGLEDADGGIVYDKDGNIEKVNAKVDVTDFIAESDKDNMENYVIMLVDADGNVYFIELKPEDLVVETDENGNTTVSLKVEFPCLGMFSILQKTDSMVQEAETETEAAE